VRNKPPKRDSELESLLHSEHIVDIEKLAIGGAGVARITFIEKSLVVFVERAAPLDQLKIQITAVEKSFLKAKIIQVVKPSAFRREAPCVYFKDCGGCSWQHIDEAEQINQKESLLREVLKKFVPDLSFNLEPTFLSGKNFHYRNRIQLKQMGSALGYFQHGTHVIVDINSCLIADAKISNEISALKLKLKPSHELRKFELKINQKNEFESYRIGETGEGLSFSQVNNAVNDELVRYVTETVKNKNPSTLSELYSGSGNFTFDLLKNLSHLQIESAELNPDLTTFAVKRSTELNLQKKLFIFTADCDSFVQRRTLSSEFILLDPPRAGCSSVVIKKVAVAKPQDLIYISCHPVSLARDLQLLLSLNSHYKIKKLKIFDMFPQTDHFETFVHLSLD
jgi:23S rRNA (uracil1939-C5)-methyltransferase